MNATQATQNRKQLLQRTTTILLGETPINKPTTLDCWLPCYNSQKSVSKHLVSGTTLDIVVEILYDVGKNPQSLSVTILLEFYKYNDHTLFGPYFMDQNFMTICFRFCRQ